MKLQVILTLSDRKSRHFIMTGEIDTTQGEMSALICKFYNAHPNRQASCGIVSVTVIRIDAGATQYIPIHPSNV